MNYKLVPQMKRQLHHRAYGEHFEVTLPCITYVQKTVADVRSILNEQLTICSIMMEC